MLPCRPYNPILIWTIGAINIEIRPIFAIAQKKWWAPDHTALPILTPWACSMLNVPLERDFFTDMRVFLSMLYEL